MKRERLRPTPQVATFSCCFPHAFCLHFGVPATCSQRTRLLLFDCFAPTRPGDRTARRGVLPHGRLRKGRRGAGGGLQGPRGRLPVRLPGLGGRRGRISVRRIGVNFRSEFRFGRRGQPLLGLGGRRGERSTGCGFPVKGWLVCDLVEVGKGVFGLVSGGRNILPDTKRLYSAPAACFGGDARVGLSIYSCCFEAGARG